MTTLKELEELLQGLSPQNLDQVRIFIESLKRKQEQATGSLGWSFDFLEHFRDATLSASRDPAGMECKVEAATCAGVTRPALWEHPPVSGSGSVVYLVPIPSGLRSPRLVFSIGIRDGAELPADQYVAFRILVNGWKLWSTVKSSHAWEEHAIEMPEIGSDVVRVEFVTDGLGHHSWDWAVWGTPCLQ